MLRDSMMRMMVKIFSAELQEDVENALKSLDIDTYQKFKSKPKDYIEQASNLDWVVKTMIKTFWAFSEENLRHSLEDRVRAKKQRGIQAQLNPYLVSI